MVTSCQALNDQQQASLDIVKGFFDGSDTAEGFDDEDECMNDFMQDNFYISIEANSLMSNKYFVDYTEVCKSLAELLDNIVAAKKDCNYLEADWDKIRQMSTIWTNPFQLSFDSKSFMMNDKDIGSILS